MKHTISAAAGLFLLSLTVCAPPALAAPAHIPCASLIAMKLPDTTITSAEEVTSGALTPRGSRELTGLPAFCRVVAMTRPAVKFEVWLPLDTWKDAEARTQEFARLFMVPGMMHCGGGPGPNSFDMLAALEQWVEQKQPPERINASHTTNGAVDRTRPLCVYPKSASYLGSGSTDDAASFVCKVP